MDRAYRSWLLTTLVAMLAAAALLALSVRPVEAAPAPTVTSVAPNLGPSVGGTAITITGTGFVAGATVTIGGAPATGVLVASATSITATTPAGTPGAAVVLVTNLDTQSGTLSGGFTFQYPAPTVSGIAPATGSSAGGTAVLITGTGLRAGATVSIGGSAATNVTVVNATTITALTPPHAIGAVDVVVTNTDAQAGTLASGFTYTAATAPTVASVLPTSGSVTGGTPVTITGTNFVTGAVVRFGGVAASGVTVVSATSITATTPAQGAAGAVSLTVTNPDTQSGALGAGFSYTPRPAPTLTGATPSTGAAAGGTPITLAGTNFVDGATVTIGGVAATAVEWVSATSITATTPTGSVGAKTVIVTNPDGQSVSKTSGFTYSANTPPTLTTIAPADGPVAGGTTLTITGAGFTAGAILLIDGVVASGTTVVSATSITATTPPHAAGVVAVKVSNADGQSATNATGFTYKAAPTPTLTSVAPSSGPVAGGGTVTLTGTEFAAGATVMFGAFTATNVVVSNATTLTVTAPVGIAGANVVTVKNLDGQVATLDKGYTYLGNGPAVGAAAPDGGSTAGGTVVTITGTGFLKGATVKFGEKDATKVVFVSATELTATTPAGEDGVVDLLVANPATEATTLVNAFTYRAPGTPGIATAPTAAGGLTIVLAGTADIQALLKAQKFPVAAIYLLDVAKQSWKMYVVGAPAFVNTLTALKPADIVILRR